MSHTYAGTPSEFADLTLPDDGDKISAASVNVPLEELADRTAQLKVGTYGGIAYLSDADHTLDTSLGKCAIAMIGLGADRTLILRQSSAPVPPEGWFFDITVSGFGGFVVNVIREGAMGGAKVARLGVGASGFGAVASCRVQLVGGVWRLRFAGNLCLADTHS